MKPHFLLPDGSFDPELLSSYDYELPLECIAHQPVEPRDHSRLMVVHRQTGQIEHRLFKDIIEYLGPDHVLVANNTRVLHARLLGNRLPPEVAVEKGGKPAELGGRIETLLLEELRPLVWECLYHGSARAKPGVRFYYATPDGAGLVGEVVRGTLESAQGTIEVKFSRDPEESRAGVLPLPPYIERGRGEKNEQDEERYQTVYAQELGSAAAPTAGLHFTPRLLAQLRAQGVDWQEVTLHVGLGTFRPVKAEKLEEHDMHEERWRMSDSTAQALNRARIEGKKIVAVGTTSVRTLESAWDPSTRTVRAGSDRTRLFIRPGIHEYQVVDAMITNFHLPKSTLLMLVGTFMGVDLMREAYRQALSERYRFFSYGDAMLIL